MLSVSGPSPRVAVVGAGVAALAAARRLAAAGCDVQVFEKSRGVGGRMATRRARWADAQGMLHECAFDHGASSFEATTPVFAGAVLDAARRGWLAAWAPRVAAPAEPLHDVATHWVPLPAANQWCKHLAQGLAVRLECRVTELMRHEGAWRLGLDDGQRRDGFTHLVIAVPPAQAAPLLAPHRPDWAREAAAFPMQPCWTLMGVAAPADPVPDWQVAYPRQGPLACLLRNEAKPGRGAQAALPGASGPAHWVAHAHPAWSEAHLDAPSDAVRETLQAAVAEVLGRPVTWEAAWVHRWRFAQVPAGRSGVEGAHWFDPAQGLGACADFLGGGGVEGAWRSGQALAEALVASLEGARAARRVTL